MTSIGSCELKRKYWAALATRYSHDPPLRCSDFLATAGQPVTEEHVDAEHERRAVQADFIAAHPSYDRPLWIFGQDNIVRQFCQRVTPSSHGMCNTHLCCFKASADRWSRQGERIFGRRASPTWAFAFKMVIFAAVIASVCIAAYATPLYRKNYYAIHNRVRGTWFNLSEVSSVSFDPQYPGKLVPLLTGSLEAWPLFSFSSSSSRSSRTGVSVRPRVVVCAARLTDYCHFLPQSYVGWVTGLFQS